MQRGQTKQIALKELRSIPGIGKSLAEDLWLLDIHKIADLKGKNPLNLYHKLNAMTGERNDPCVLYTFRCAVYFASEPHPEPEKLKWWNWKDQAYCES